MRVLVFLQNAWARDGRTAWRRESWELALWRSHTGRRLKDMLPYSMGIEVRVCNASPAIGTTSGDRFPMERWHVEAEVAHWLPDVVVLLGGEARKAAAFLRDGGVRIVEGPHPAYRLLSKAMAETACQEIVKALQEEKGDTWKREASH